MKETELYLPVKRFLEEELHLEVFPEVNLSYMYRTIDIVGIRGNTTVSVELKNSLNTKVIYQAKKNKHFANYSFVAIPASKLGRKEGIHICGEFGIGIIEVTFYKEFSSAHIASYPDKNRPFHKNILLEKCTQELKEFNKKNGVEAGQNGGGYATEYKLTMDKVENELKYGGPIEFKELLKKVTHHYSNDYSLLTSIRKFETERFATFRSGRKTIICLIKDLEKAKQKYENIENIKNELFEEKQ